MPSTRTAGAKAKSIAAAPTAIAAASVGTRTSARIKAAKTMAVANNALLLSLSLRRAPVADKRRAAEMENTSNKKSKHRSSTDESTPRQQTTVTSDALSEPVHMLLTEITPRESSSIERNDRDSVIAFTNADEDGSSNRAGMVLDLMQRHLKFAAVSSSACGALGNIAVNNDNGVKKKHDVETMDLTANDHNITDEASEGPEAVSVSDTVVQPLTPQKESDFDINTVARHANEAEESQVTLEQGTPTCCAIRTLVTQFVASLVAEQTKHINSVHAAFVLVHSNEMKELENKVSGRDQTIAELQAKILALQNDFAIASETINSYELKVKQARGLLHKIMDLCESISSK